MTDTDVQLATENAILRACGGRYVDPADAVLRLAGNDYTTDAGELDLAAITADVDRLLEIHPHYSTAHHQGARS